MPLHEKGGRREDIRSDRARRKEVQLDGWFETGDDNIIKLSVGLRPCKISAHEVIIS